VWVDPVHRGLEAFQRTEHAPQEQDVDRDDQAGADRQHDPLLRRHRRRDRGGGQREQERRDDEQHRVDRDGASEERHAVSPAPEG
jgi:hypothetical protein